jgi:hypothetical protein
MAYISLNWKMEMHMLIGVFLWLLKISAILLSLKLFVLRGEKRNEKQEI